MGKTWRERFKLDLRMVVQEHVCHWGMMFFVFLVMVVYLRYYFVSWSDEGSCLFPLGWGTGSNQSVSTSLLPFFSAAKILDGHICVCFRPQLLQGISKNYLSSSIPALSSGSTRSASFCFPPRNGPEAVTKWQLDVQFNGNLETRSTVQYKWKWESPEVEEIRERERFGEEDFGETLRRFVPVGTGSFLFVLVGAYRTGPSTFGLAGLGSKYLYRESKPAFECSWVPSPSSKSTSNTSSEATRSDGEGTRVNEIIGTATTYTDDDVGFHDWSEYTAVVVYCTFDSPVGIEGEGGQLNMIAKHDKSDYRFTALPGAKFVAMVEQPGAYNESVFDAPFRYEYLYCGPPLRGSISPYRAREWIAYHMRLFGENSHFIFYDAGGIDDVLWRVWEPWVKLGRVSIMNVKMEARYKAYLSNQFVLANDCLLRAKSLAKWTFFFDIDEFLHLSRGDRSESSFHELMSEMGERGRRATTIELQQRPMSPDHCVRNDADPTLHERQWAMEKLVYRRHVNMSTEWSHWHDIKSIHQAKYVLGRGVHYARHVEVPLGMEEWETITHMNCADCYENKLHYYHYRGTTARAPNEELCKVFVDLNVTYIEADGATHEFDNSIALLADSVKEYEAHMIGKFTY